MSKRIATVTRTPRVFSIEIGGRLCLHSEGPFSGEEAVKLGQAFWDILENEKVTHVSENGGQPESVQ